MADTTGGFAVPVLPVSDVRRALLEYRALGFTAQIAENEDYGFLRRGGIRIHLYAVGAYSDEVVRGACYIYVEDADELAREWSRDETPGRVEMPRDTEWRMREGSYTDSDGNVIRFGSHLLRAG